MRVEWHGQSAFTLAGEEATVFVDPWGDMSAAAAKGIEWGYPPIASPAGVDLLVVTHEHSDHTGVEVIQGEPTLVRSLAGTHPSPLGEVVAIASEHDGVAAAGIAIDLGVAWAVPMHYRTERINFLETEESFVAAMPRAKRLDSPSFDTADLERGTAPTAIVPAAP